MDFIRNNTSFIVTAILLTILLLLPSYILSSCPKGLTNDTFPGRCGLYTDKDQNQVCDLSEVTASDMQEPIKTFNLSFGLPVGAFTTLLVLATAFLFLKVRSSYRYLLLAFGLIIGFFSFKNICPIGFLQYLLILKEGATLNIFLFVLFLLTIISAVLFGRTFCGWVCPIGAIEEFLFRIPRWLRIKLPDFTKKLPSRIKYLPLVFLVIGGFLVVKTGTTLFCKLDPFGFLFGFSTSKLLLGALVILFIISFVIFRPFCLFLCPLGGIFFALSSISIWRIKRKTEDCAACSTCFYKCPTGAINEDLKIDQKQCLRCFECLHNCPLGNISYEAADTAESEV